MKNLIIKLLPRQAIAAGLYALYFALDLLDRAAGRAEPMVPPRRLMFDGPRDIASYKRNGEEFLKYFVELCRLSPSGKVLDVGSGIGRKAQPLTRYLDARGGYEGFDITKVGVDLFNRNISARHPNFRFRWVDVFNKVYNPKGRSRPSEFEFPYPAESFDLVILGSVFTHMLPADMEHYLSEIARVMKKGGKCLISYFLLNDESRASLAAGKSSLDFKHDMGAYLTVTRDAPEYAVCFGEEYVRGLYAKSGLEIDEPIRYGNWCERKTFLSYQDLIIATKA